MVKYQKQKQRMKITKMRKIKNVILSVLSVCAVSLTVGSVFALWAVDDKADPVSFVISTEDAYEVNYYLVNSSGEFSLGHTEYIVKGDTIADAPSTSDIGNYTFEKWSTSNALSDTFNVSTPITSSINLYSAYVGYFASTDASNYYQLTKGSGTVGRYLTKGSNTTTDFDYTYSLSETSFTGATVTIYKKYLSQNNYSSTSKSSALIYGNSTSFTGKFKLYFDGNTVVVHRRIYVQLKSWDGGMQSAVYYLWQTGNNYSTQWPGVNGTWLKDDSNDKYYFFDIETSLFDNFKATNSSYNEGCYRESSDISLTTNLSNNCVWLNSGGWGWMNFSE